MFSVKCDKSVDISANHVERSSPESLPWQTNFLPYWTSKKKMGTLLLVSEQVLTQFFKWKKNKKMGTLRLVSERVLTQYFNWKKNKKMGTLLLVSERVLTQSFNWKKNKKLGTLLSVSEIGRATSM
jgi:hypothetical protein